MGLAAIPNPCLPLSDSETLGSLIFLIYLLSLYPSAPLQMYKLHEGEGFSLHFFSCILYTLNSAWYIPNKYLLKEYWKVVLWEAVENKKAKGSIFVHMFSSEAEDDEDMSVLHNDIWLLLLNYLLKAYEL